MRIMARYDELSMFLSQMNVFSGKKITDSHELSVFLQLYGANSWVRKTGKHPHWKDCNANTIMALCSVCIKI